MVRAGVGMKLVALATSADIAATLQATLIFDYKRRLKRKNQVLKTSHI